MTLSWAPGTVSSAAGYDLILTKIAQGYVDRGEYLGNFVAPVVGVPTRSGRYLKFGKEAFAAVDTLRAPMTRAPYVESSFTHGTYTLEQHALAYRIAEELEQEAKNGEAKLSMRELYINDMMSRFQRAHEIRVFSTVLRSLDATTAVTNWNLFAPGTSNNTLIEGDRWNTPTADMIYQALVWKQRIADEIGVEPNRMIMGSNVNIALAAYGTHPNKNNRFFGDPGREELINLMGFKKDQVKVANKQALGADGKLKYIFDPNGILMFYSPEGSKTSGVLPDISANMGAPSFAYTFQLDGYPVMTKERFDDAERYYTAQIIAERKVKVTGATSALYVKVM